ncbi:MAG: hypothetical protein WCC21_11555 [Candidatus Acidiferrales bacterium]
MYRALDRLLGAPIAVVFFLFLFVVHLNFAQTPAPSPGATVSPSSSSPPSSPAGAAPIQGSPRPGASHGVHVVTVTFDYDFSKTPACTAKITKHCITQFIAYDISGSARNPIMLFPIPLPPDHSGPVKGITKASPPLDFESGKHLISISAMSAEGTHSKRSLCTTWITIP